MYRSIIDSIGVALPARAVSTREVIDQCVYPLKLPLEAITGIAFRRVAGEGEFALDLADRAARDCFRRSAIAPGEVDLLISASISRHDGPGRVSYEPSAAVRLRQKLGCARAWTFDIANACAGNFTGIYLADALIRTGQITTALVVSGEFITPLTRTAQLEIASDVDPRIACLTLGDAGSAVLLTRSQDKGVGFEHISIRTIGEHHALCVAGPTDAPHGGAIMKTETLPLATIMVRESVDHTVRTLARLDHSYQDIDYVIPHQTSLTTLDAGRRQMNRAFGGPFLRDDNVVHNLAEMGNTSTTTHIVALWDGIRDRRIRTGSRTLFSIAGSGVNVGTAVYTFDDLPDRLLSPQRSTPRAPSSTATPRQRGPWTQPVEVVGIGCAIPENPACATTSNLIAQASADCLRAANVRASDVTMLIHAGLYRSGMIAEPAIAAIAAGELGLDGTTTADREMLGFDLANGGLGLFDACRVASALIHFGQVDNALVIASEVEERPRDATDPGIAACGSAMFLRADPGCRRGFLGFHARHFSDRIDEFAAWATQDGGPPFIGSGDRAVLEEQYLEHLPLVVAELLDDMKVSAESVRGVVPPYVSPASMEGLRSRWPILGDRIVALPWLGGDLFTSAMPMGLQRLREKGAVGAGDLVVLTGAGSGVQIGAALYCC